MNTFLCPADADCHVACRRETKKQTILRGQKPVLSWRLWQPKMDQVCLCWQTDQRTTPWCLLLEADFEAGGEKWLAGHFGRQHTEQPLDQWAWKAARNSTWILSQVRLRWTSKSQTIQILYIQYKHITAYIWLFWVVNCRSYVYLVFLRVMLRCLCSLWVRPLLVKHLYFHGSWTANPSLRDMDGLGSRSGCVI